MCGKLRDNLAENQKYLGQVFGNSADFYFKYLDIAGQKCRVAACEDLVSVNNLRDTFLKPLSSIDKKMFGGELVDFLIESSFLPVSTGRLENYEDVIKCLTAGFGVFFVENCQKAVAIPVQNFPARGVDKPTNENNLHGSKESFTDVGRKNMSLVRRRIRSSHLVIETLQAGEKSNTEILIYHHSDYCPRQLYQDVKSRLSAADTPFVLDSGYIAPFVDRTKHSLFGAVGYTERADTFCAKLCEGKVGIMVDGSPYALVYPFFFQDNFVTNDDYIRRPYFASFLRILRFLAFIIAIALPGMYVAFTAYSPQSLANKLLFTIYSSQNATPLPLFAEAIMINILLEIVKEAGLRLPESIGSSVSLVSALIIGDAAINAGIVGGAVLIVCAVSAIASYIVPSFHQAVIILRMIYILAAGLLGIPGIALATMFLFINIANIDYDGYTFSQVYSTDTIFSDGILVSSHRNKTGKGFSLKNVKKQR